MPAERTIGNYVLGPILGRGGMSEVYAAAHRFLGDPVAIKLLHAHAARTPGAAAAFLAEATRTRSIEHPNVVRVLDFGVDGDACYLVMERLAGESLAARLDRAGPLDEPALRALGAALADGLAAAHDRGIVHRDLKPANVVLAAVPKIVDFGIARELAAAGAKTTGSRVGTLAYMAPEQLAGGLVAPCVDVWALGVLLFEACTGALPFAELRDGLAPQLVDASPRLGARASAALDALVAACLERDPRRRPASMRAIAAALRAHPSAERFTEDLGATPQVTDEVGAHVGAPPRSADLDRHAGAARVTEDLGLALRLANEVDAHVGAAPRNAGLDRGAGAARVTADLGLAASRLAKEIDAHVGAARRSAGLDRGAGAARVTEDLGLAVSRLANEVDAHVGAAPRSEALDRDAAAKPWRAELGARAGARRVADTSVAPRRRAWRFALVAVVVGVVGALAFTAASRGSSPEPAIASEPRIAPAPASAPTPVVSERAPAPAPAPSPPAPTPAPSSSSALASASAPASEPAPSAPAPAPSAPAPASSAPAPASSTPAPAPSAPAPAPSAPAPAPSAPAAPPAALAISLRTTPPGASVVLAGAVVATTPATLTVALPAELTITRAGFRSARVIVDHPGSIDLRLVPLPRPHHPPRERAGETLD